MASPTQMMKLPAARAGQIKALAAARGIGATEALERLLNLAIEAGELDDALPGWEVRREGDSVTLTLDGQTIPAMTLEVAALVAHHFERAGTEMKVGRGYPQFYGASREMGAANCLTIGRHGGGVVVALEVLKPGGQLGEGERTLAAMTRGMAVDLARQIRKAITH